MIVQITEIRPDETVEIHINHGSILNPRKKLVEIQLRKTAEERATIAQPHTDANPPYRRKINF